MAKRILFFIPSLLFIALIGFVIAVNAPGDPVQTILHDVTGNNKTASPLIKEQEQQLRHRLGLDLPVFYFSIHSLAEPDTLYRVYPAGEREMLLRLVRQYGNWNAVSDYYITLKRFVYDVEHKYPCPDYLRNEVNQRLYNILNAHHENNAFIANDLETIVEYMLIDKEFYHTHKMLVDDKVIEKWQAVSDSRPTWRNYVPAISFHLHNQFHRWLFGDGDYAKGIIRGDFGVSYTTLQPVSEVLKPKIKWSLLLSFLSLVISLTIAIPLGTYSLFHPHSIVNKFISGFKNFAFAAPVFWFATLLLITFANPTVLKIFPASGIQPAGGFVDESFLQRICISSWYLILPLICYSYASIALLAATVQSSLRDVMKEPYITTAFAKGLSLKQVVRRHAMRNALLPLITLVANFFPAALGGSVIIENIFSIPGMGNEIANAVYTQNYPVIVAIVTITGFLTLTGFLIADLIYRLADPRIRFANEN